MIVVIILFAISILILILGLAGVNLPFIHTKLRNSFKIILIPKKIVKKMIEKRKRQELPIDMPALNSFSNPLAKPNRREATDTSPVFCS
jgi:hypothetical protein